MRKDAPSSKVSGFTDRNTSQMGAHAKHDQPLGLLDSLLVTLRIAQRLPVGFSGLVNLRLGPVPHEDGLAAPFDDDVLALRDCGQFNLNLGERKHVRRGRHGFKEFGDGGFGDRRGDEAKSADHKVRERAVAFGVVRAVVREIWDLRGIFYGDRGVQEACGGWGGGRDCFDHGLKVSCTASIELTGDIALGSKPGGRPRDTTSPSGGSG